MNILCKYCKARHFSSIQVANKKFSFNDCCNHGEAILDELLALPPILQKLYDGTHLKSNQFYSRIRYYNSSFSFASLNADLIRFDENRPGPFCELPTNGQLFIIDANEASLLRCEQNDKLDLEIVNDIETELRQFNIIACSYQMMKDVLEEEKIKNNDVEPELQLLFTLKPGMDCNRYNFQRINEVAAVFSTTADGDIPESYVTVKNTNTKQIMNINTTDPNVEPLVYPLFYPHGTKDWHKDISCVNKNKSITRNAYIKYRLAIRNDFNKFLLGRRLFQQWVVDSYVKIEKDRIRYCKNNQKQLRVETYQGLIDYSHKKSNDTNSQIGKMIILPSSFINSPRTYVDVIEFQKRGLPHMHMLITLKKYCKINTSVLVDKYISAEIPDPTINPKLHNIVMNNMIHGPCGDWCLVNSKCSKKYPKSFVEKTAMDENGYPHYRRKNTNIQYIKRLKSYDFSVNNSLVVPHNQRLLLLFNCHINIGIVSSIRAVKYSYKYIYKGHDAAAFNISNSENIINHDEIKDYLEGRYVGPVEACWRIFNKELQNKSHTVTRLPIHLPNQQSIVVHSTENDESIISALDKAKQSQWHKRQTQFNVIGRMYSINPKNTELFHLRLLLLNIKGATSFDDFKTVNGVTYNTFVDTCLVMGLIEDDDEWKKVMTEAESWMMPHQLRRLFVRILIHCQPLHPEQLWETFKNATSEDFLRQFGANVAYKKAYIQINTLLIIEGSSLNEFSSMEQITDIENSDFDDISPQEHNRIGQYQYNQLNKKQKDFVDHVTYSIDNVNGENNISRCFFVDGPGGSVPLFSDATSNIKPRSKQYEYLKKCDLFIWDEAPMAPRYALELVDRTLRDIMNNTQLFGGKILALGGDFRQLLPVSTNAPRIANGTLNDSNDYLTVPDDCIADEHCNMLTISILAPRNTDVDEINNDVVNLLDATTAKIYKSIDSIDQCDNSDINDAIVPEYVNSLNPPNFHLMNFD
ncbi:uncharacterized protein [Chelonus insularis]|uniref:uncharacterized protein n=1 Tax=Chelonus insularis TaxID=460826 RepID=UPI00158B3812|nr:uncharacterized protein LOC118069455 [Chelonus insularis]